MIRWYYIYSRSIMSYQFTQSGKRLVLSLSLHYNGRNSLLFVNAAKVYQFKAKDSEIKEYPICLDNVSKDFTISNIFVC